jgi:hypothetical protein
MLMLADQLKFDEQSDVALIATRGTLHTSLLSRIPKSVERIYLWPQNDQGGEVWLAGALATLVRRNVRIVRTAQEYKDLNEWVQSGEIGEADLLGAIKNSEAPPEPEVQRPTAESVEKGKKQDEHELALALLAELKDKVKCRGEDWYFYDRARWRKTCKDEFRSLAQRLCTDTTTSHKICGALYQVESSLQMDPHDRFWSFYRETPDLGLTRTSGLARSEFCRPDGRRRF